MKKVLVPTDFTKNATHAVAYAAEIASKMGAELLLMHANVAASYALPVAEYYGASVGEAEAHEAEAIDKLQSLVQQIHEDWPALSVRTAILDGAAIPSVLREAEEEKVDLIVMGTRGAEGVAEYFVGSNTERVVRESPAPVLAVPAGCGPFKLKTAVLATTLRDDQLPAFRQAARLQRLFDFKLHVLYLNDPSHLGSDDAIDARVEAFADKTGVRAWSLFSSAASMNEEKSILQFAEMSRADLVVMATHQRRGLKHFLFGSLTEDAINHAKMPVLAVPVD